ncbi:MAG: gliding motility-associated C-terminal domain-containing protein [Bacteroidota bacterium]
MKKLFYTTIASLLISISAWAQPSNNNCTGAIVLTPGASCVPVSGTTAGATQSQPACSGAATDDVWYTFTANSNSLSVVVAGSTAFNAVVQLFSGSCGGTSMACVNATGNGGIETITSTSLVVGTQYWVRVHHFTSSASSNPTFTICVTAPLVEPPCDPNSVEPSNSCVPCLNVPKICRLNGFCGTTQGYHATPTATTLTPYAVNTWAQLSTAFCGSIENNSFMRFEASASTVQLRVYGSCASGTGIQMLAFSYVNPTDCGFGPVTSYGCFSPLTFPSPAAGIPLTFTGMVPGQIYYLMVDGFAGAVCDYKIGADFGVQVSATVLPGNTAMCLGSSLNLTASGGNGTYTWDPDPTLSALTGSSVFATPTAIGNYAYVLNSPSTDPACPGSTDTAFVTVGAEPTPDAGSNDSLCLGQPINLSGTLSNATNTAQWEYVPPATGPAPNVVFSPSANVATSTVSVDQPGLYKFIFKETNTICGPYRDTIEIWVLDPQLSISSVQPSCYGYTDGSISVVSPDAVDFSFDSQASWQLSSTSLNYASGTFEACVRDVLGCVSCDSVVVPVPANVLVSVSNDTIVCENGTASMSAQGTVGTTFNYHWSHTANMGDAQTVSPTVANYYYVYAENQNGCMSETDSIYVDVLPPLTGSLTPDFAICPGDNALITATASDGNGGPYSFTWSTGATGTGYTDALNESPVITTTYQLEINDGCESTHIFYNMTVVVSPVPNPMFDILDDSLCEKAVFDLFNTTDPNMVQNSLWVISDGQVYANLDTIETAEMNDGFYDVSLTITSPDGCINTTTVNNALRSMPRPTANFRYAPTTVTALNTTVSFDNLSIGNDLNHWTMQYATPAASTVPEPIVKFPEGIVDNYTVELIAETNFGCTDTMYQIIEIKPEVILYSPNTFTPDDDEFNATWKVFIEGVDVSEFELKVYNRWGQLIWESHDPAAEWDGTFKGEIVGAGSYNWTLKAKDAYSSENHTWRGNVLLIK